MSGEMKPLAPMESKAEKAEENPTPRIPLVRTKKRGRVGSMLEHLANSFKSQNPGWACRWIYHPQHKPDLSSVIMRQAEGYEGVLVGELGVELPGLKKSDMVRVGDVVMMKIPEAIAVEDRKELAERAKEQRDMLKKEYYSQTEGISTPAADGGVHKVNPRGDLRLEDRVIEVEREQRTSS